MVSGEASHREAAYCATLEGEGHDLAVHDIVVTAVDAAAVASGAQGLTARFKAVVRAYDVDRPVGVLTKIELRGIVGTGLCKMTVETAFSSTGWSILLCEVPQGTV